MPRLSFADLRSRSQSPLRDKTVMTQLLVALEHGNEEDVLRYAGELFLRGYSHDQFLLFANVMNGSGQKG